MFIWWLVALLFMPAVKLLEWLFPTDSGTVNQDPVKQKQREIGDLHNKVLDMKKYLAVAIAEEKRLRKWQEKEDALAKEWLKRAAEYLEAEYQEGHAKASSRAKEHDAESLRLKDLYERQRDNVEALKKTVVSWDSRHKRAKRELQELKVADIERKVEDL